MIVLALRPGMSYRHDPRACACVCMCRAYWGGWVTAKNSRHAVRGTDSAGGMVITIAQPSQQVRYRRSSVAPS